MELKKESMQILKEKSRAKSQITFDEDFNVPDAKPDAGRLIQNKGRIIMDDVRLTDGKGILTGNLQVDILYVGEERGIVSSLTAKLPFEETLNLKDIINGDKMCLKWEIEDLTIRLIHSRKLNIKALVTFCATVDETEQIRLPVALDAEEVSVRKKTVRFLGLTVHKKDTLHCLQSSGYRQPDLVYYGCTGAGSEAGGKCGKGKRRAVRFCAVRS